MRIDPNQVKRAKEQYPPGTRIRLNHMDDPQQVPDGTEGTVQAVDDAGQLLMKWDNGRSLSLLPGVDSFSVLPKPAPMESRKKEVAPKEWLAFLREQFPEGSRIHLSERSESNPNPIPSGSVGRLLAIDDNATFRVQWDDGMETALDLGQDRFKVLPPEYTTLKLYMTLTADVFERDEYGDIDEDDSCLMDGRDLAGFEDQIRAALLKERTPEEGERGLMHWYSGDDGVNDKVHSMFFNVEYRNGQLWGVAECQLSAELSVDERETLIGYATGQASDGFGEGFEQRPLKYNDGELSVHLWNSDTWSIQTEQERFDPKFPEKLPDFCLSVLPEDGKLICIKKGEAGYYPSEWESGESERNRNIADYHNRTRGITPEQEKAMVAGSMFGWDFPGANPAVYAQKTVQREPLGGMRFG